MRSLFFLTLLLLNLTSHAAPAPTGPICRITGIVEKLETRTRKYEPESWRKSWNLPKEKVYFDVSIKVSSVHELEKGYEGCEKLLSKRVFQLKEQKNLKIGRCLRAKSQFSGDEFSIGQWLYDIEYLPEENCRQDQSSGKKNGPKK